jgi:hypothetical protein
MWRFHWRVRRKACKQSHMWRDLHRKRRSRSKRGYPLGVPQCRHPFRRRRHPVRDLRHLRCHIVCTRAAVCDDACPVHTCDEGAGWRCRAEDARGATCQRARVRVALSPISVESRVASEVARAAVADCNAVDGCAAGGARAPARRGVRIGNTSAEASVHAARATPRTGIRVVASVPTVSVRPAVYDGGAAVEWDPDARA